MRSAALLIFFGFALRAAQFPTPAAELDLRSLYPSEVRTTVAFVSEQEVVVFGRPGVAGTTYSATIAAFGWRDGKLKLLQSRALRADSQVLFAEPFAATHGGVILVSPRHSELLSADVTTKAALPFQTLIPPVQQGNIVAANDRLTNWKLYRLVPQVELLREGDGRILSVSDDFVVIRRENEIRVEKIQGEKVGSFQVPPESVRMTSRTTAAELQSSCVMRATIVSAGRLFLQGCGPDRIADFNGRELLRMPSPDGWGFRQGFSADGTRMLFDNYMRRISVLQKAEEAAESAVSLGMAPDQPSTGEMIRVVDTTNAMVCMDLDSPDRLFGMAGKYHADLSPSGRYVALVTSKSLSIYAIPACTNNPPARSR